MTLRLILATLLIAPQILLGAEDWELRKDDDGIKIYTRAVEGSSLDQFKGVGVIDVSMEKIVALMKDPAKMEEWSKDCSYSELLSLEGNVQIHYSVTDAPFPIDDRDSYVKSVYKKEGKNMRIAMSALPYYGPEKEDRVRITTVDGFWLLEPISSSKTRVTYQLLADPGGSIPDWLANSASVETPFNTIKGLRDYLIDD